MTLMSELIEKGFPPKYDDEKQIVFLKQNSWKKRVNEINSIINSYRRKV